LNANQLTPKLITPYSDEYSAISEWLFPDSFVSRMLLSDIPDRVFYGNCRIWIYQSTTDEIVGFGALESSSEYPQFTDGQDHFYIPLIAVNPSVQGKGYGRSILKHLIETAAQEINLLDVAVQLFLDVYTTSERAINLYLSEGFLQLSVEPIDDEQEPGAQYLIMSKPLKTF
jgi:ribosomal protein S18 acetylase RimI-like enzyme